MDSLVLLQILIGVVLLAIGICSSLLPYLWQANQPKRHEGDESATKRRWTSSDTVSVLLSVVGVVVLISPFVGRLRFWNEDRIAEHKVVSIEFTMYGKEGNVLESSRNKDPLVYLHGFGELPDGLEAALEGKRPGDEIAVTLQPDEAYGAYDESLVETVAREQFDIQNRIEPGMRFEADTKEGPRVVHVVEVKDKEVVVDANEPFAGRTVRFEVKVLSVRNASPVEIETMTVRDQTMESTHDR